MQHLRKPLLWTAAISGAVLFMVWVGLLAWIHTRHSRQWIQSQINAAIPGSLSIGNHRLSLIDLRLELFQVAVHDADGQVLAGVEHLVVDGAWLALWRGEFRLEEVRIRTPWADLRADDTGAINLISALIPPALPEKPPGGQRVGIVWPVGLVLENGRIDGGRFTWRTPEDAFQLEVDDASLLAIGDLKKRSGRLEMELADARFTSADIRPQPAKLRLKADWANRSVTISELALTAGRTRLDMTAAIADLDTVPTVDGLVTASGPLAELQTVLNLRTQLEGTATVRLACKGNLDNPTTDLSLAIGKSRIAGLVVDRGNAALRLQNRQLAIDAAVTAPGGGRIHLQGDADLRGAFPGPFLQSPYDREKVGYTVSLTSEVPDLSSWLQRWTPIRGKLSGRMHLTGKGFSPHALSARLEIDAAGSDLIAPGMLHPVAADLQLSARMEDGQLTVSRFNADSEVLQFSGDGHFDWRGGDLEGRFIAAAEDLASLLAVAGQPTVSGVCQAAGVVSGTPKALRAELSIDARAIGTDAATIGDIDMRMAWEKGVLTVDRLQVTNKGSALRASGRVQLTEPDSLRRLPDPTVDLTVVADHFDPGDFVAAASGSFRIDARLTGSLDNPAGRLALAGSQVQLAGQPLESIVLDARLETGRLWLDRLVGTVAPQQAIRVSGWMARDRSIDLQLAAEGVAASRIDRLQGLVPGDGVLQLTAAASGTVDNPMIDGRLTVSEVVINAEPFEDFSLDFNLQDRLARVSGQLDFGVDAFCHLDTGDFEGRLDFNRTETAAYFKAAGQPKIRGTLTGQAAAKGNFRDAATITAHADLAQVDLYYGKLPLVHSDRIHARLADGTLTLASAELTVLSTGSLTLGGQARIGGGLDVAVAGRIPLAAAGLFSDHFSGAAGNLDLEATLAGKTDAPQLSARILLEDLGLDVPGLAQRLHGLNGRIRLTPETVHVAALQGSLDTGSFEVDGTVGLDRFRPQQVDVNIVFQSLPLEVPDTMSVVLDGGVQVSGDNGVAGAAGTVVLLEGVYYKDMRIDLLQLATDRQRSMPPPTRTVNLPYFETVRLDLAIGHRQPFLVQNNLADLEISPDLAVGGSLSNPIVSGRAQVRTGTVTFQKKTFAVTKGVLDFINPYKTEPEIDIESRATIRDWDIFLAIKGVPDNLVFSLTSQPAETEADILSLILFGRTARELTAGTNGSQRTTSQIMAEMIADTVGGNIKKKTGIDILEVETGNEDGGQDNERVTVTVGKRLSDRMTVKYAVETKAGETVQRAITEYKLLEHISVSGFQEDTGNYGSELVFRIEFR